MENRVEVEVRNVTLEWEMILKNNKDNKVIEVYQEIDYDCYHNDMLYLDQVFIQLHKKINQIYYEYVDYVEKIEHFPNNTIKALLVVYYK